MAEEKTENSAEKTEAAAETPKGLTEAQQQAEFNRLQRMTVTKLREEAIAKFHDQLKGVHGMRKTELLNAMCGLMGIHIETEHHASKLAARISLPELKARMKKLKTQRIGALEGKDSAGLRKARKKIKKIKRTLRRMA